MRFVKAVNLIDVRLFPGRSSLLPFSDRTVKETTRAGKYGDNTSFVSGEMSLRNDRPRKYALESFEIPNALDHYIGGINELQI
mgnify:FL=1